MGPTMGPKINTNQLKETIQLIINLINFQRREPERSRLSCRASYKMGQNGPEMALDGSE